MTNALLGRMRAARCVEGSSGNIGCATDVMSFLDKQCSGKRTCAVEGTDRSLHALSSCPPDTQYLEVAYTCVNGKKS